MRPSVDLSWLIRGISCEASTPLMNHLSSQENPLTGDPALCTNSHINPPFPLPSAWPFHACSKKKCPCYSFFLPLHFNPCMPLAKTKWSKKIFKNDWNPDIWVLIWEYSARAIQWVPTWQGLDGFQKTLHSCARPLQFIYLSYVLRR